MAMIVTLRNRLVARIARLARLHRFVRRQDGAVAVEFAIVAAPFIALLFAILETTLVFFAGQVLETAVAQSGRSLLTGQAQTQNMSASTFAQSVCNGIPVMFSCGNLMVDVQAYNSFSSANTAAPTLTYDAQGKVTNNWQYQPGNPGDIVVMRVMYQWPVFLGPLGFNLSNLSNGSRLLMATAVFKSEPY